MKTLNRQELIDQLMWNSGGMGFGICSVASSFIWATSRPKSKENDLKSVVAVSGPPDKYTDEELEKLVEFSNRKTANYDEIFNVRMGANLICIDKNVGPGGHNWMRKRMSWEYGPMYSDTIEDAMATFDR